MNGAHTTHTMKAEDRAAIIARNRQQPPKIDAKQLAEAIKANQVAAQQDEWRTEGHNRTRRPLSTPHEPI